MGTDSTSLVLMLSQALGTWPEIPVLTILLV